MFSGQVYVGGETLSRALDVAPQVLSYCPPQSLTWSLLSLRETLALHVALRRTRGGAAYLGA